MIFSKSLRGALFLSTATLFPFAAGTAQEEARKPSIAVLPFRMTDLHQHQSGMIHLKEQEVNLLTNRFVTALVQTRKFTVVEREKLESLLKEMDLTKTGIVDPKKGVAIGKAVGADYFLTGEITALQGNVQYSQVPYTKRYSRTTTGHISVQIRLIQTETTAIVAARDESFDLESKEPLTDGPAKHGNAVPAELLEELQRGIVNKLTGTVVDACYPIKVVLMKDDTIYLNRGEGGGLTAGDRLTVFLQGEALVDPDTKEVLGSSETEIAKLEVLEVGAKSTKAKVLRWLTEKKEMPKGAICRLDARAAVPASTQPAPDKPKIPN